MIKNTTKYTIKTRWNRYAATLMADISSRGCEVISGIRLRPGDQILGYGVRAKVSLTNANRYHGDIKDASILFYSDCLINAGQVCDVKI